MNSNLFCFNVIFFVIFGGSGNSQLRSWQHGAFVTIDEVPGVVTVLGVFRGPKGDETDNSSLNVLMFEISYMRKDFFSLQRVNEGSWKIACSIFISPESHLANYFFWQSIFVIVIVFIFLGRWDNFYFLFLQVFLFLLSN